MVLERFFPDVKLPKTDHWWKRVLIINVLQASVVLTAGKTWDLWLQKISIFSFKDSMGPVSAAFACYLVLTFVYYWWHRWRHEFNFLWLSCHQLHHSPQRIETITSFYKHPFEIFLNSILVSAIAYILCGISVESAGYLTIITAYAEFFYHMNIKTPHFLGYFFQRPEMHRVHHQLNHHSQNYADLPIWDILFGTFSNPKIQKEACGFSENRENRLWEILKFQDVHKRKK